MAQPMDIDTLRDFINANVVANDNRRITGTQLNVILTAILNIIESYNKDTITGINGVASYTVDADTLITGFVIYAPTDTSVICGKAPGGNDIFDWTEANPLSIQQVAAYFKGPTTLYFTGLLPNTIITVYKNK
jgi:hypothetical protein